MRESEMISGSWLSAALDQLLPREDKVRTCMQIEYDDDNQDDDNVHHDKKKL